MEVNNSMYKCLKLNDKKGFMIPKEYWKVVKGRKKRPIMRMQSRFHNYGIFELA